MTAAKPALIKSDASGLEPFFQENRKRVYQFAFQLTGDSEDAMDVTQEAFLRLHREWGRLSPERELTPLLFTVVRNLALDLLRKRVTRRSSEIDGDYADGRSADPEDSAMRGEVTARLRAEIAALPVAQREALLLRDWHGLSYAQIAEVTGTSVAAVTSRIHDARTRLRERMRRFL